MLSRSALDGDRLILVVPGRPRPQPRPRAFGGRIVSVADPNAKAWRDAIVAAIRRARAQHGAALDAIADADALDVRCTFLFGIKDKKRQGTRHCSVPDGDNCLKLALDAAQLGGLFPNDNNVARMRAVKFYVAPEDEGMIFEVRPLEAPAFPELMASLLAPVGIARVGDARCALDAGAR